MGSQGGSLPPKANRASYFWLLLGFCTRRNECVRWVRIKLNCKIPILHPYDDVDCVWQLLFKGRIFKVPFLGNIRRLSTQIAIHAEFMCGSVCSNEPCLMRGSFRQSLILHACFLLQQLSKTSSK